MATLSSHSGLPEAAAPGRRRRRGPDRSTMAMVAMLVVGLCILGYPTFADWWNNLHQAHLISQYMAAVEKADPELLNRMWEDAEAYNERLLHKPARFAMTDEDRAEYESLLNLEGLGIMGYVQVPAIGITYPLYHGVSEEVLQKAIGHIEGSSLPVGGPTTHAAVSGHRGLPSAILFSDLDRMREGDVFVMKVLDRTLTYQVDQIHIVEPTDLSDLDFSDGEDLCTLVTCTPYGVNTHRLLVRGHRIDNIATLIAVAPDAVQIPNYIAVPAVGIPMLFAYLVGSLVYWHFVDAGWDRDLVMEELGALRDAGGPGES